MNIKIFILNSFCLLLIIIKSSFQKEEILFNQNFTIKFAEVIDLKLNLTDLILPNSISYETKSFLNIITKVEKPKNCDNSRSHCNQPIVIYGKLNSPPEPDNLDYDIKDEQGSKLETGELSFGFEFTPCEYKNTDTLYIKIVGIEGRSNFNLIASYNLMHNYSILCAGIYNDNKENSPPLTINPSVCYLENVGTITFGGKDIATNKLNNNMYILNNHSLEWQRIVYKVLYNKPDKRYGALIACYNNYIILFGGKNESDKALNDLWVFDYEHLQWHLIDEKNSINIPSERFTPSYTILENKEYLIMFGGTDDSNLYMMNLNLIPEVINQDKESKLYVQNISSLWKSVALSISPRIGCTITQISHNELLIFGGLDMSQAATKYLDIVNLDNYKIESITPTINAVFPSPRAYHNIIKYGKILVLYGGENSNSKPLNDMWKLNIETRSWIPIKEDKSNEFYLYRSRFDFVKINNNERPVIYGGKNRNKEASNDLVIIDYDLCLSDNTIKSDFPCLPCSEGYILTAKETNESNKSINNKKCSKCPKGTYHNIYSSDYSASNCELCPPKTYNPHEGKKDITSCKLCKYGYYNPNYGQKMCIPCPKGELCLPGSSEPSSAVFLKNKLDKFYLYEENNPDFISSNRKIKATWQLQGFIISLIAIIVLVILLLILSKFFNNKIKKCIISIDFLPITGGAIRRFNGGVLTIVYIYFNIVLILTFILRFIYYNELTEVIPISSSHGNPLKSSYSFSLYLIGYEDRCIDRNKKLDDDFHLCSSNINYLFSGDNDLNNNDKSNKNTNDKNNNVRCKLINNDLCVINTVCENCKIDYNKSNMFFNINSPKSSVKLYYWNFYMSWGDTLAKDNGYSLLEGVFKPDNNKISDYLFSGETPSNINILLTPVFYSKKSSNIQKQGYRASFKSYDRGSLINNINKETSNSEVHLNVNMSFSSNQYEINVWKQIAFLDFYAFILGMFAGLSFLTRVLKNILERLHIGNDTEDDSLEENPSLELVGKNNLSAYPKY